MSSDQLESINCKVVLLGETGVGKTCLIERYTKSEFHDNFAPTLGGTFIEKEVTYKKYNKTIKFQIWDTAGQEKYRSINKLFYSDANIAILVYDITRKETFDEIKNYWYEQVKENSPKNIQIVLVGNKSDLYEFQEVPTEDVKEFADEFGVNAYECSAKTAVGTNVNQYTKLNYQKRVSMSGNRADNNFICSSVKVTVSTSFFLSSFLISLISASLAAF